MSGEGNLHDFMPPPTILSSNLTPMHSKGHSGSNTFHASVALAAAAVASSSATSFVTQQQIQHSQQFSGSSNLSYFYSGSTNPNVLSTINSEVRRGSQGTTR